MSIFVWFTTIYGALVYKEEEFDAFVEFVEGGTTFTTGGAASGIYVLLFTD